MRGGIMFDQSDIVLIPFPYTDLTGFKKRPALIISNNKINYSEDRICCLISSNPSKDDILISKNDFKEGKLPFKSFVRPKRIFTINEKIIIKKLCKINSNFHQKIIDNVYNYLKSQ